MAYDNVTTKPSLFHKKKYQNNLKYLKTKFNLNNGTTDRHKNQAELVSNGTSAGHTHQPLTPRTTAEHNIKPTLTYFTMTQQTDI